MTTETKPLSTFPEDIQKEALALFAKLASSQRGRPEFLGTSPKANPGLFNATGIFTWTTEHVGDLTHRMSQPFCERMSYGWENVEEKTRKALRTVQNSYGFEREVADNLHNNFMVEVEDEFPDAGRSWELWSAQKDFPWERWNRFEADFIHGAALYANAYATLVVWNEMQWNAQQAAVKLGLRQYDALEQHLRFLRGGIDQGRDGWSELASTIIVADGKIIPYRRGVSEGMRCWASLCLRS